MTSAHSTSPPIVEAIARRLWQPIIPPTPVVVAVPRGSWRTLHVGQHLANLAPLHLATGVVAAGERWEVAAVDSLGATAHMLTPTATGLTIARHITTRDWKQEWRRLRKPTTTRPRKPRKSRKAQPDLPL